MTVKMLPMPRKRSTEKTATIRVRQTVADMVEVICTAEDTSSSDVASPILEKALKTRYLEAAAKIQSEAKRRFGT